MITPVSPFRAPPRMSREGFIAVLRERGSFDADPLWAPTPVVNRPKEAGRIYDLIVVQGHDPAVWLAIAGREHSFGTNPNSVLHRNATRSWTNARSVRDPSLTNWQVITDRMRGSQYVRYASVVDSVRDGLYRVDDPAFAYAGKTSIREIIGVWAPADDGNNPNSYAVYVAEQVTQWAVRYPVEEQPMATDDPQAQWLQSSNYTAGRGGRAIDLIILHTTEGNYQGSLNWLRGRPHSSNTGSSSHYLMDANGGRLAQLVRERDTAWTAGNWAYNQRSINIEMEGYAGAGGFSDGLYRSCAALVARIAARHRIPLDRQHIIGHAEVPNQSHWDPGPHWDWGKLMKLVDEAAGRVAADGERRDPVTGMRISGGFRAYYEWLEERLGANEALMLVGRPISEEFDANGLTVQAFERQVWEHHPGARPDRWDVLIRRLGADWFDDYQAARSK